MASKDMLAQIIRAAVGVDAKHHGILLDITNKLGGDNADAYRKRFAEAAREPLARPTFSIFRTIKLGTCADLTALKVAVNAAGGRISDYANDLLNHRDFTIAAEEIEVDLVVASVAELGFEDGATYADICAKAQELGLQICPAEVGPQLRLQYTDQPNGEWLRIAMDPIADRDGRRSVFDVVRDRGELWLVWDSGRPDRVWSADDRFVFVLPRK